MGPKKETPLKGRTPQLLNAAEKRQQQARGAQWVHTPHNRHLKGAPGRGAGRKLRGSEVLLEVTVL